MLNQVNFRCDGEFYAKWKLYADALGVKMSELFREIADDAEAKVKVKVDKVVRRQALDEKRIAELVVEYLERLVDGEPVAISSANLFGPHGAALHTVLNAIHGDDPSRVAALERFLTSKRK